MNPESFENGQLLSAKEAIELAIAQLYGLPADEYETVIDSFDFDDVKKTRIIRRYREICQDGEKEL